MHRRLKYERVVHELVASRSVVRTASALKIPETEVKRIALTAFGLGQLDDALLDY